MIWDISLSVGAAGPRGWWPAQLATVVNQRSAGASVAQLLLQTPLTAFKQKRDPAPRGCSCGSRKTIKCFCFYFVFCFEGRERGDLTNN